MMRKFLICFIAVTFVIAGFCGCNGNESVNSAAAVTILTDNVIYSDELPEGTLKLDVSVTGTKNTDLIYMLDQADEHVSIDKNGLISVSSSVTDDYRFTVTAVLEEDHSKYNAKEFTVKLTRGLLEGERQVGQVVVTVNGDPSVQRGISWFTTYDVTDSDVLVSTSPDMSNPLKYSGTLNIFEKIAEAGGKEKTAFYNHQCVITGLNPNTVYYYKVGSEAMNLYSSVGSFKTVATDGAVKFMITTDVHIGANEKPSGISRFYHAALSDALNRYGELDFAINTGDMVTQWNGGYSYFESEWARAMNISPLLKKITFVPVAGNHDQKHERAAGTYSEFRNSLTNHYSLPESPAEISDGNENGPNYSFDASNVHFIVLNVYDPDQKSPETDKIKEWVKTDLASTDKLWKVAFSHRTVPDDIKAVLEENGVVVAYSGHEHFYRRTKPMASNVAQEIVTGGENENYIVNPKGTTYVTNTTTGGADEFMSTVLTANDIETFGMGSVFGEYGKATARWGMYTVVTVNGNTFKAEIYVRPSTSAQAPFVLYNTYGFIIE